MGHIDNACEYQRVWIIVLPDDRSARSACLVGAGGDAVPAYEDAWSVGRSGRAERIPRSELLLAFCRYYVDRAVQLSIPVEDWIGDAEGPERPR